jgi:hypothetical protein
MSSYEALAGRYDALTADVHYEVWADYAEKHFRRAVFRSTRCGTWPAGPEA